MRDEGELLAAMASGNERALEELYDGYAQRLYGLGLRLLGEPGLAEEVVQETFVRLWQQAARFDARRGNGRTFIFTVARRIAVDLWRRPSSRPIELAVEEPEGNHVDELVTSVAVRDAMASLSEPHRQVLEMLHFQQLTQSEAAVALNVPLGTVKTRSFHALRALRTALGERGLDA